MAGAGAAEDKDPIRLLASPEIADDTFERFAGLVVRVEDAASCDLRIVGPEALATEGVRVLRRHRLRWPEKPVVVVHAADASAELVRACFRAGASDVLPCASEPAELDRTLGDLIRRQQAGRAHEEEARMLAAELGNHARDLEAALRQLSDSYDQTLNALVAALDMRERETAFHSQRVALYSVCLGLRLGLERAALENLYRGALLHDIGKIGTPDAVLLKPGSFTEEEWEIMRRHASDGGAILQGIAFLCEAADVPRSHHEAWDGSGYPDGLVGEAIPFNARIFAVIDSYDAIRSKRPYKEAQPHERAVQLLRRAATHRLDPAVVECFVAEPESTWAGLENTLGGTITFEICLTACRSAPR